MVKLEVETVKLLQLAASKLRGYERRTFVAEVTLRLCKGKPRLAEKHFGWSRATIEKGLQELQTGVPIPSKHLTRVHECFETKHPKFADDLREIVEPKTQADPELKSERRYLNLSAAEVRLALIEQKGWKSEDLPAPRTMRSILNRLNYRLRPIQKSKPLKKTKDCDAIFANVQAVKQASRGDPETLEISADTKAKVVIGDFSRGEKSRTGSDGKPVRALDHDFGQNQKLVPFGLLNLTTRTLQLIFGEKETSDSWLDAIQLWWEKYQHQFTHVKRLVFYLDNGPNNSGSRTQFLKRMVQFCDWCNREIRLVYYPPYHSKYNPVERCWSALERKWSGLILNSVDFMLQSARRMTWCGQHPAIDQLPPKHYPDEVTLTKRQMLTWEDRLLRSSSLPKYDITIHPGVPMKWYGYRCQ